MSVASQLGIDEVVMPDFAAEWWPRWSEIEPRLGLVEHPEALEAWRREAEPDRVNDVLLGLARLASVEGIDDTDAALVLAWLLLPAAGKVLRQLRHLGRRVDETVAAQLWIEVRNVAWRRSGRVASRIAFAVREGVLREFGQATRRCPDAEREIPSAVATCTPDDVVGWRSSDTVMADRPSVVVGRQVVDSVLAGPGGPAASETLVDLLSWAHAEAVIGPEDALLLVALLAAAQAVEDAGGRLRDSGCGGLVNAAAVESVAVHFGVSPRTIKRRAARTVAALSAASGRFFESVAV